MKRPKIIAYLNPNIEKDTKNLFIGNMEMNEHYRLSNLIHAGFEGYSRTSEENVELSVKKYLKEQNKLKSHEEKYYRSK